MVDISSFLNVLPDTSTITRAFSPGYESSNLQMLLQQARKSKAVQSNYLYDFIQVENDPNYSKRNSTNRNKLESLTSRLSSSTQMSTAILSLIQLTDTKEFIPAGVKQLLYNFQSLSDTGINYITQIQDKSLFKQLGINMLSDLTANFKIGNISFNEIALMSNTFLNNYPSLSSIGNNGIRGLLSVPLGNLLPRDMLEIYKDLNYLNKLYELFEDGTIANTFNSALGTRVKTYSGYKVSSIPLSQDYKNATITLDDPLGYETADALQQDIVRDYTNNIEQFVREEAQPYNLPEEAIVEIVEILKEDAQANVEEAFFAGLGLPGIANVSEGVSVESYNETIATVKEALSNVIIVIIREAGIAEPPKDVRPFDYLYNIKKNLDARAKMKQVGAPSDSFVAIGNFLKTVVKDGNINEQVIEQLHNSLNEILKED